MASAGPMAGGPMAQGGAQGPAGQRENDPLLGEKAKAEGQAAARREKALRMRKQAGNLAAEAFTAMVPWSMFVVLSICWTFLFHASPGSLIGLSSIVALIFLVLLIISCGFGHLSVGGRQLHVGETGNGPYAQPRFFVMCLLGICGGILTGYYNYDSGFRDYWSFFEHWQYSNVWPDEPAAAHRDAAAIVFAEGSRPDAASSSSFTSGHHSYCAAPVRMSGTGNAHRIQYWAVGVDCCSSDPLEFKCDDADSLTARAGLVVYNRTHVYDWYLTRDMDFFEKAARMATAKYGIASVEEPIFLRWSQDIESQNNHIFTAAMLLLFKAAIFTLPVFILVELGLHRAQALSELGYKKMKKGSGPNMQSEASRKKGSPAAKKSASGAAASPAAGP